MKYKITLFGCDDTTTITKELTEDQAVFILELAEEISEASLFSCMPVMEIEKITKKK